MMQWEGGSARARPGMKVWFILIPVLAAYWLIPAAPGAADAQGAPAPALRIAPGETWVTRTTDLTTGESVLDSTSITWVGEGDSSSYLITRSGGKGISRIYLSRRDLAPYRHQVVGEDGRVERQTDLGESAVRIAVRDDPDTVLIKTSGPAHTGSTLLHYLRSLAAGGGPDRVELRLLVHRGAGKYRVVDVFAKRAGIEDISVPAGDFRCVKIEFGVAGIIGRLFWRTRYHYFYTAQDPHHFVKYVDPDGECIELVEYECGKSPGATGETD